MEEHKFDLDQELLKELSEEFDILSFIKGLKVKYPVNIQEASDTLGEYGKNLARKSIEKGEQSIDRVYEVIKQIIEKTGEMKFPLVPQRYVEIAYLSIQPIKRLRILENSSWALCYRLNGCTIYDAIAAEYGEEAAKKMVCKSSCFALLNEIFSHFDLAIESSQKTSMASDGQCQFKIEKK